MTYLVDTSVWTQSLLGQPDAAEADAFLIAWPTTELAITEFAWNSIGVTCDKRKRHDLYLKFTATVIAPGLTKLPRLEAGDPPEVVRVMQAYGLDYDDAYQYMVAEKHGLRVVALDRDFRRTPQG